MDKPKTKRVQISEAQSRIMLIVSVATIIVVFCLASAKALLSQAAYQNRVINAGHASVKQLEKNKTASQALIDFYKNTFLDPANATNLIGGKNVSDTAAIPPDGDNAKLVLNALPTTYDFAGLISSVAKILASNGIASPSVTGTDQSATAVVSASNNPSPVEIDFNVSGQGSYVSVQNAVKDFERSIRPFKITQLQLNGTNDNMNFTAQVVTYYQPSKTLDTTNKKVQ